MVRPVKTPRRTDRGGQSSRQAPPTASTSWQASTPLPSGPEPPPQPTVAPGISPGSLMVSDPYSLPMPDQYRPPVPHHPEDVNAEKQPVERSLPWTHLPRLAPAHVRQASLTAWGCEELLLLGERTSGAWRDPGPRWRQRKSENVVEDEHDTDFATSEEGEGEGVEEPQHMDEEGAGQEGDAPRIEPADASGDVEMDQTDADAAGETDIEMEDGAGSSHSATDSDSSDGECSDGAEDDGSESDVGATAELALSAGWFATRYRGRNCTERLDLDQLVLFMRHQAELRGVPLGARPFFLLSNPLICGEMTRMENLGLRTDDGSGPKPFATPSAMGRHTHSACPRSVVGHNRIYPVRRGRDGKRQNAFWVGKTRENVPSSYDEVIFATLLDLDSLLLNPAASVLNIRVVAHADVVYRPDTVIEASMLTPALVDFDLEPTDTAWALSIRPPFREFLATREPLRVERIQIITCCKNLQEEGGEGRAADQKGDPLRVVLGISNVNAPRRLCDGVCFDSAAYWLAVSELDLVATYVVSYITAICQENFGWDNEKLPKHLAAEQPDQAMWKEYKPAQIRNRTPRDIRKLWRPRIAKEVLRYILEPEEFNQQKRPDAFRRAWKGQTFHGLLGCWERARALP